MKNAIKNNYVKHKSLFESFISLYILNGLNLILPLVSLPYLLRVVGPANYGVYAFIYVIIQYILLVSKYGFDFSATKQISQTRDDSGKVSSIYHSVMYARIIIAVIFVLAVLTIAPFLMPSRVHYSMLVLGMGMVLGDILVPSWFFQGLEKMRYLTIVNVLSKSIFTILIFLVIKKASDFQYIILLNSLGSLMAGIISIWIVYRFFQLRFKKPDKRLIAYQFKDGLAVFGSTLGMNLYRNSNIFILGLFVSDVAVGIYAAAEKVIKAIQSIVTPIAQALFPHMSNKFKTLSIQNSILVLISISKRVSIILLLLSLATFLGSTHIVRFFGGEAYANAIPLIQLFSPVILFGGINYIMGIVGLINLNKQKEFFRSVLISGSISVVFLLITVQFLGNVSAVWAMLISEIVLFMSCSVYLYSIYHRNQLHD